MTSDKDKKIEAAANEKASRCNVSWAKKEWQHDVDTFTAGAKFGYELAQEELKAKVEALQDNLKFISKSNDRLSKSYNFDQQHISDQANKITELESEKNEIALIAGLKDARIYELEQRLKKAESYIETIKYGMRGSSVMTKNQLQELAQQYLTNKGGKGD